ncbi:MAG: cobyric acid synthase [Alphaproteobacteria bacterium]
MVQGTGSHVGKSLIVAGLCRALNQRGVAVAPFKPQNMSNNAAVAVEGGEIGRSQALQARAAGVPPSVHMNPVLLKPEADTGAQVVVQGRPIGRMDAATYFNGKADLMARVLESFAILGRGADLILVEGAGSPAETNLRRGDIANMGFAEAADVPVILAADIDRGGVIAALVGTHAVLGRGDAGRIRGFMINKFRGDAGLFDQGVADICTRTGWPSIGVIPWFAEADRLPAEDSLGLPNGPGEGVVRIVVPRLPRIANFDDLDPLRAEPGFAVEVVEPGRALPGDASLILLPGSKSTIADLAAMRAQGWDIDIHAHQRRGGRVLGVCGGFQMLGRTITDPHGVEGSATSVAGLGLLDVETVITREKATRQVEARSADGDVPFAGYEIHTGTTTGPDADSPFCRIEGRSDGAVSPDGRVAGTYVHGLFSSDRFRSFFRQSYGLAASELHYQAMIDQTLDNLAAHLEASLDMAAVMEIAGL